MTLRVVVVVLGIAVASGSAWWVINGSAASATAVGNANVVGGIAGVVALLVQLAAPIWVGHGRRTTASVVDTVALDKACEFLARETLRSWREQAKTRRITTPSPVAVRWQWASADVAVAAADLSGSKPSGRILTRGVITQLRQELYEEQNRLVILGDAGAGKTTAMLLLLIDILENQHDPDGTPIPVWVTLSGWVPQNDSGSTPYRPRTAIGAAAQRIGTAIRAIGVALRNARPLLQAAVARFVNLFIPPSPAQQFAPPLREEDPAEIAFRNGDGVPLQEWVSSAILRDYPDLVMSAHGSSSLAVELIRSGRVALFLDGLDEMAQTLRGPALRAIDRLSAADGIKVVLASRQLEFLAAQHDGRLFGAAVVEILPVGLDQAEEFLLAEQIGRQRLAWKSVAERLHAEPDGALAKTLTTPLALTLARDTYQKADPTVLFDANTHPDSQNLLRHLLGQSLRFAYPDPIEYKHATYWLSWMAKNMRSGRDLTRSDILGWGPQGYMKSTLVLTSALVGGLAFHFASRIGGVVAGGLAGGLAIWLMFQILIPITNERVLGLVKALAAGSMCGVVVWLTTGPGFTAQAAVLSGAAAAGVAAIFVALGLARDEGNENVLGGVVVVVAVGFAVALMVAFGFQFLVSASVILVLGWFALLLLRSGFGGLLVGIVVLVSAPHGLRVGLLVAVVTGIGCALYLGLDEAKNFHREGAFAVGLVGGIAFGICAGVVAATLAGSVAGAQFIVRTVNVGNYQFVEDAAESVNGFWTVLIFSVLLGLGSAWLFWPRLDARRGIGPGALLWMEVTWRIRGRSVRFTPLLETALDRQVLRRAGAVYQFRHAELQNFLAAREDLST